MPLYTYRCAEGHLTDRRRGVKVANLPCPCGECGRLAKRTYWAPAIKFVGPGFHNTDYARPAASADD